jgi:hypothetical protein
MQRRIGTHFESQRIVPGSSCYARDGRYLRRGAKGAMQDALRERILAQSHPAILRDSAENRRPQSRMLSSRSTRNAGTSSSAHSLCTLRDCSSRRLCVKNIVAFARHTLISLFLWAVPQNYGSTLRYDTSLNGQHPALLTLLPCVVPQECGTRCVSKKTAVAGVSAIQKVSFAS